MDPTPSELATFGTLKDVLNWVGMADEVWDALCNEMGAIKYLREIVLVPQNAWDSGVQAAKAQPVAAPAIPGGTVAPTPPARPR